MKSRFWTCIAAVTLLAALAIPVQLGAQNKQGHRNDHKHHHYKVIEMEPYGGPGSTMEFPGQPPVVPFVRILNREGDLIGNGFTSTSDPFCYLGSACLVGYVFRWQDGVQSNLGVLPENPVIGPQTPCLDCGWSTFAFWIADTGLAVGESEDNALDPLTNAPTSLAVVWQDGKIVNLGTLGGNESAAAAVNRKGDVVGAAMNSTTEPFPTRCGLNGFINAPYCDFFLFGTGTESHAFLWHDGAMQDLGTLGGPDSAAFFVNRSGQIAGSSDINFTPNPDTGSPTIHPFLWHNGKMVDLVAGAPPGMFGGTYGIAGWLNDHGQVIGTMTLAGDMTWHSFFWDQGVIQDLGTLGGNNTSAQWLNEGGDVVGKSDVTAICTACPPGDQFQLHHPFLWRNGVMTDLGLLYADTAGTAYSINAHAQVVGGTVLCIHIGGDDTCDGVVHAFLWEHGSMVDVQTLLLPGSGITLASGAAAFNINDRGEIAGQGVLSNGDARAVLLIPCDENHSNIEGCDYKLVEGSAALTADRSTPKTQAPTTRAPNNTGANGTRSLTQRRFGRRLMPEYRGLGRQPSASTLSARPASATADASLSFETGKKNGQADFLLDPLLGCRRHCRHSGYCEAAYSNGKWQLDGLCVSHNFQFCDIQGSSNCPNGKPVRNVSLDSCGPFGSAEVDLTRPCSF